MKKVGELVHSFLVDYLTVQRGFSNSSVKSYRDVLRLYLLFVSQREKCRITKLDSRHFTVQHITDFLTSLEQDRQNSRRTRNQRLAVLRCFSEYMASQSPEFISEAQRIGTIQTKRCSPPETFFLEQSEVKQVLGCLSTGDNLAFRDSVLLLFMYNTGARVQELADLQVEQLELDALRVRLCGKGAKWRICPLWKETVVALRALLAHQSSRAADPVFLSNAGKKLTRFGIYKVVRKRTQMICKKRSDGSTKTISPHTIRHTTAMHLLESGVEINVIRGWLGHVSLETTNRYTQISIRMKESALQLCEPPIQDSKSQIDVRWRDDEALLKWLASL